MEDIQQLTQAEYDKLTLEEVAARVAVLLAGAAAAIEAAREES